MQWLSGRLLPALASHAPQKENLWNVKGNTYIKQNKNVSLVQRHLWLLRLCLVAFRCFGILFAMQILIKYMWSSYRLTCLIYQTKSRGYCIPPPEESNTALVRLTKMTLHCTQLKLRAQSISYCIQKTLESSSLLLLSSCLISSVSLPMPFSSGMCNRELEDLTDFKRLAGGAFDEALVSSK